jgi:hypothetical protein
MTRAEIEQAKLQRCPKLCNTPSTKIILTIRHASVQANVVLMSQFNKKHIHFQIDGH